MNWIEIKIYTTTEGIENVSFELLSLGINGFCVTDSNDFKEFLDDKNGQWDYIDDDLMGLSYCETFISVYLPDNEQGRETLIALRERLSALLRRDADGQFGRLECEISGVNEEDWANNWKQYFKPFNVGKRLCVKPSWENADCAGERIILEIDPASSFGSGQHHTTKLCLEALDNIIRGGEKILDLGCGSGILSIGAILLGAKSAVAVDIMQNASDTARENAAKNNISPNDYTSYCGDIIFDKALAENIGTGFDVITANIVADVLIAMAPMLRGFLKSGGTLIVSGIISERADEVDSVISANGFRKNNISVQEGWAAIEYSCQ